MLLDDERADECEALLESFRKGSVEVATTDFIIDSIVLVMEREGKKPGELSLFLSSLLGYKSLQTYFLSIYDRIEATRHVQSFNIDFDDSTTCQAMKNLGVDQVVSFDRDLDKISDIKRIEPREILEQA